MTRSLRLFKDKRAITPILSNLLLTVVAVAAMTLATTATYIITTDMRETMSERLIIEDVWLNNSTGTISIYLHNIGKVAIHVSAVYVNHTAQSFIKPFNLELDENKWLNFQKNCSSGDIYYVDIVTTRGTHVANYYKSL